MKRKTSEFSLHSMFTCFRVNPYGHFAYLVMHVLGCYSFIKNSRDKFVSYSRLILKNNPKFHSCTKGLGSQENKNDFSASNNGNPGVLLRILGGGVQPGSKNPDPISDKKKDTFYTWLRPSL